MSKARQKILFIGSLDVAPTFGGPIQFHRHFIERNDFEFQKIIEPSQARLSCLSTGWKPFDRLINRLTQTRLSPHFAALNEWLTANKAIPGLLHEAKTYKPDVIVTVAFGAYGFAAGEVARRLKIPLVTFFHDWWPDLAGHSQLGIKAFDQRMRRLYRQSDLALCVCEQMRQELGQHPNSKILYPISRNHVVQPQSEKVSVSKRLRVTYLGGMTKGYGRMIVELSKEYARTGGRTWEFAVFGEVKDWPASEASAMTAAGVYRGTRYGEAAQDELAAADIFLVAMDFEPATRRRVRTSFPSKLLEYCAFGKPIVVWAPAYSSVMTFAQQAQLGLIHSAPDAVTLIDKINKLVQNPAQMTAFSENSIRLAKIHFCPDIIHAKLVTEVNNLLHAGNNTSAIQTN